MRPHGSKSSISDFVNDTLKRQLKASLRGATDVDDIDRAVRCFVEQFVVRGVADDSTDYTGRGGSQC